MEISTEIPGTKLVRCRKGKRDIQKTISDPHQNCSG